MADTVWKSALTRPHWAGANATVDEHLEIYDGEVETRFQYYAIFLGLSAQRSVADRSNTYRIDRLGQSSVKGRRSGEELTPTRVTNEKLVFTVDTVLYIRNPIDYQDDWTAPDFLTEMGQNNGSAFAELYDEAHLIQLIKSRTYTSPEHLKPAIGDGKEIVATIKADAATQSELEANAISINLAHKKAVDDMIKRKVPLTDRITMVTPEIYSALIEHPKLMNLEYDTVNGGTYSGRRMVCMNGIPVVECTEFPKQVYDASTRHPLDGTSGDLKFAVSAEDLKCKMVIFSKSKTLVTIEAKPFTSRIWDDETNFCNVLDCYAMYTVGQRRPDTCIVVKFNEPA